MLAAVPEDQVRELRLGEPVDQVGGGGPPSPPIRMSEWPVLADSRTPARDGRAASSETPRSNSIPSTAPSVSSLVHLGERAPAPAGTDPRTRPAAPSASASALRIAIDTRRRAPPRLPAAPRRARRRRASCRPRCPGRRGSRSPRATMTGSCGASSFATHPPPHPMCPASMPEADRREQRERRHADQRQALPHLGRELVRRAATSLPPGVERAGLVRIRRIRPRSARRPPRSQISIRSRTPSTTTSLSIPTASRSRCGIVTRPCPSSFTSSDEPKNRREYARPSASERGKARPRRRAAPIRPWGSSTGSGPGRGEPRPVRRTHRGTSPATTPCPWGRAGSCACRAVRPRLLPFPPLCSTFMPPVLHCVNRTDVPERLFGTGGYERQQPGSVRATPWRDQPAMPRDLEEVVLPAGLEPAEGQAEPVRGRERLARQVEPGLVRACGSPSWRCIAGTPPRRSPRCATPPRERGIT